MVTIDDERFSSWMGSHVFDRVKISIYDIQGDEYYTLDMPPAVYEHLKELIKKYEEDKERNN